MLERKKVEPSSKLNNRALFQKQWIQATSPKLLKYLTALKWVFLIFPISLTCEQVIIIIIGVKISRLISQCPDLQGGETDDGRRKKWQRQFVVNMLFARSQRNIKRRRGQRHCRRKRDRESASTFTVGVGQVSRVSMVSGLDYRSQNAERWVQFVFNLKFYTSIGG